MKTIMFKYNGFNRYMKGRSYLTAPLCLAGIVEFFSLPADCADTIGGYPGKIYFVLSKTKIADSYKFSFEMTDEDYEWSGLFTEDGIPDEGDWMCYFDGHHEAYLMYDARHLLRTYWDQGYQYIRCEYDS